MENKIPLNKLVLGLGKTKTFTLTGLLAAALVAFAHYKGFSDLVDENTAVIIVSALFTVVSGILRLVTNESVADKVRRAATKKYENPFYELGGLQSYLEQHPDEVETIWKALVEHKEKKRNAISEKHVPKTYYIDKAGYGQVLTILMLFVTLVVGSLMFAIVSHAGSGSFGLQGANGYMEGRRYANVVITGGVSGNGTGVITGQDLNTIKNHYMQEIITSPGASISAYTITMTDTYGRSISVPARSTTAVESYDVPSNMGRNWSILGPLTITLTGIGNGKQATVTVIVH